MISSKFFRTMFRLVIVGAILLIGSGSAVAQDSPSKTKMDFYGYAMLDMGYQFNQNDPDYFDVIRPTKLPAYLNEFGEDGHFYSGVRQTRFGVKTSTPTEMGELKTLFEFNLFGSGPDAGQTTFRLRHAYGELGKFGAGQTWSPFTDVNGFPKIIEYWGPCGMALFRNVQVRWMPLQGDTFATIALEKPGGSGDGGLYQSGIVANGVQSRFPVPDLSAEYHRGTSWGYIELAGILRYLKWDDQVENAEDLSGDAVGWGFNLSSNITIGKSGTIHAQVLYGEGIENNLNDSTMDVAAVSTTDPARPLEGKALPVLGFMVFYDLKWNAKWSSSIGYSMTDIYNVEGQLPDAYSKGHYALVNLLCSPVKNVLMGLEAQYGKRENYEDGFTSDDFRIQFSAKYSFSSVIGG